MSPVIRISDGTYEGLQSLAEPFTDTPDSTIARLLAFYRQHKGTEITSSETSQDVEVLEKSTRVPESLGPGIEEREHQSNAGQEESRTSRPRTPILGDFTAQLKEVARVRGFSVERWSHANPSSANLIEVNGPDYGKVYYVKTSKELNGTFVGGFWGLTTKRINALNESGKPWVAILLVGSREKSYLLTDTEVEKAISSSRWSCDSDGDQYKIKEGYDLKGFSNYNSYEDLFEILISGEKTDVQRQITPAQFNDAETQSLHQEVNSQRVVEHKSQLLSLSSAAQRDIGKRKPVMLEIEGEAIPVRKWADLCEKFVCWLVDKGHLTTKHLPLQNHAGGVKYFINTKPEHFDPSKDASGFHLVAGLYVDTKYNAPAHVKNLLAALEQLGLEDLSVKVGIPLLA
jgi:hypothetical protein